MNLIIAIIVGALFGVIGSIAYFVHQFMKDFMN
jgi:hypothetical protein